MSIEQTLNLDNLPISTSLSHRNSINMNIQEFNIIQNKHYNTISTYEDDYNDLNNEITKDDLKYNQNYHIFMKHNNEIKYEIGNDKILNNKSNNYENDKDLNKEKIILKGKRIKKFWLNSKTIIPSIFKLLSYKNKRIYNEKIDYSNKLILKNTYN